MMRIALGLEYDGQGFAGWQRQTHQPSLQQSLETALSKIAQETIVVHAAGRTDAGVHAIEQVIHFDTTAHRPITGWVRGANSHLPQNMSIKWAKCVPDDFHARFSALSRCYTYWLIDRPTRPGLLHGKVGWCFQALDIATMQQAAQSLLGQNDFSSFRSSECQAKSPIKNLSQLTITEHADLLRFEFKADAFLHHMVRNIMGALVYVGKGTLAIEDLKVLISRKNRDQAPPTFMPDGLYLASITYPQHFGLPQTPLNQKPLWVF